MTLKNSKTQEKPKNTIKTTQISSKHSKMNEKGLKHHILTSNNMKTQESIKGHLK